MEFRLSYEAHVPLNLPFRQQNQDNLETPRRGLNCISDSRHSVSAVACAEGLCRLYLAFYLPDVFPSTLSTGTATFYGENCGIEKNLQEQSVAQKPSNYLRVDIFPLTVSHLSPRTNRSPSFPLPNFELCVFPHKVRVVSTDPCESLRRRLVRFSLPPQVPRLSIYLCKHTLSNENLPLDALAGLQTQGTCINASMLHSFTLTSSCTVTCMCCCCCMLPERWGFSPPAL